MINRKKAAKVVAVSTYGLIMLTMLRKLRKRRFWVRDIYLQRAEYGFFETTYQIMKSSDHEMFKKTFRMSVGTFNSLLALVYGKLEKRSIRRPIQPECRLSLTLMYLAYGTSRQILALKFKMGVSTITNIILETCQILWETLSPIYLKEKTREDWYQISENFEKMWDFPNFVGAIDGKHINIVCPPNSGSENFNYKHRFSVILMATCDANYLFTAVDVRAPDRRSDGCVFAESTFGEKLLQNELDLPAERELPGSSVKLPYFFVGDAAFPLRTNLMRPFPGRALTAEQEYFNRRLSRARRTIENAFGIMSSRWRVLLHDIHCLPKNVVKIVCATVVLHNYLRRLCTEYCPPNYGDNKADGSISEGQWREETQQLQAAAPFGRSNNASASAFAIREKLCGYVNRTRFE